MLIRVRSPLDARDLTREKNVMPELPEVETIRRDLARHIIGKTITGLVLSQTKVVRGDRELFKKTLMSHHVTAADRIGKLLIFSIDGTDQKLLAHLKMTGQFIYRAKDLLIAGGHSLTKQSFINLPNKHTRAEFHFVDGGRLFFNDMRLFAYIELVSPERMEKIYAGYGIEPGTKGFTKDAFVSVFQKRTTSVKAVLLNQSLIAGVGNIYADEACWRAGIRPSRRVNQLTGKEIGLLYRAVDDVIKLGIEKRGTTFNHFVDGDGNSGGFLPFLKVYGRTGKPCKRCHTPIKKTVCAGRGTHYCPKCQK